MVLEKELSELKRTSKKLIDEKSKSNEQSIDNINYIALQNQAIKDTENKNLSEKLNEISKLNEHLNSSLKSKDIEIS